GDVIALTPSAHHALDGLTFYVRDVERARITVGGGPPPARVRHPPAHTRPRAHHALDGLTFYVRDVERARITVGGCPLPGLVRNPPDHTGRPSVSVPWPRLEFPRVA